MNAATAACAAASWRHEPASIFCKLADSALQFPLVLSFASLKIQGVLVAHLNNPARLREPAL